MTLDDAGAFPSVCYRCVVAGRVQGVYFRASTRQQAVRLGVSGYARNLPDGRVEVLASGNPEAVAALRDWLRSGPPMAKVDSVTCTLVNADPQHGFRVA